MLDQRVQTYLEVVESGSFTKAAKKQFRSTVAIMKQVSALEKELGVKLLVRSHRGVAPTAAGKYFFTQAQEMVARARQVTQQVKQIDQRRSQIIHIGTSLLRPSDDLIKLWLQLAGQRSKDFTLQLVPFVDQFGVNQDQLLTPQMDCILTPYSVKSWQKYYDYLPLGFYSCEIGIPRQHPLAGKVSLTWADLEGQTILLLRKGISAVIDQMREEIGRHHNIHVLDLDHLYDIESFNLAIQSNSLIEIPSVWQNVNPEVKAVPMNWDYQIPYGLLYRKNASQNMQGFVSAIRELIK